MTDCKILLEWPLEKLWRMFPIVLEPHRPYWHTWYEEEAARLRVVLPEGVKIHHIGSTAIPGICAKPIIDLLVELPRAEAVICAGTLTRPENSLRSDACTHDDARASTFTRVHDDTLTRSDTYAYGAHAGTLARNNAPTHSHTLPCDDALTRCKPLIERCGYLCMSERPNRMSFNKGYTPQGYAERVFHLHLRLPSDTDECLFRDYLRRHPAVARSYERLKQTLAARYRHDRDAYTAAKTSFVTLYTQKARGERTA